MKLAKFLDVVIVVGLLLVSNAITGIYFNNKVKDLNEKVIACNAELKDSVKITHLDIGDFIIKNGKIYDLGLMSKQVFGNGTKLDR